MKIMYTERSLSHLQTIQAYLLENAPEYVDQVMEGLLNMIESLVDMPGRGRPTPELLQSGGDVREIYYRPYRVCYLIESQCIYILAVQHQRQKRSQQKNRDS